MLEIEIKVRVPRPDPVRARLLALGAVVTRERHREDNTLFDFSDGRLTAQGRALRLRTAGKRATLTFKGAPRKSRRFKVREEFETQVRDGGEVRRILKALGLRPIFRYVKMRTAFRLNRVKVCLDELVIGHFLEMEGERPHIARLAEKLGIPSAEWIREDYIRMLIEAGYAKGTTHSSSCPAPPSSSDNSSVSSPSSSSRSAGSSS